ncbi:hypothetical protein PUR71_14920 [Streptomyces sp. SP17BM10]|uniref:hypothetical protein n=1 Tax=Streptomyces sp. SP17BM10 TaxID=3002530 RepID=UPI002E7A6A24|nr:hypothetical protein [Streptomyces sp. SP17BM10]MEE1784180.1 hypothetical protein [Streptomyces sp. SP17BM10]
MEKIIPTESLRATLMWPVTGLCTGTPVLVRRLMAPHRERRAEAAALRARREQLAALAAEAAEAELAKKLVAESDPVKRAALLQAQETAQVTAREIEQEQARAARKASFDKVKEAAGGAALLLIVGGPLVWSLARPWIGPGIGLIIGGWWIAALIHAPAPTPKTGTKDGSPVDSDDVLDDVEEDQDEPRVAVPPTLTTAELTATVEHMVAIRAQRDDGRGHVHLSEILQSLQRHDRYPGYTARDFGSVLRSAGLPVERSVRVKGATPQEVTTGFSFKGLTAHLGHPPRLPARPSPEPTPAEAV